MTESNELFEQANKAVEKFNATEAGLAELRDKYGSAVYPVETTDGMKEAKAARQEIRRPRYTVENLRKEAKAPILALGRDLDARAKELTAQLLALEKPIDEQIKVVEQREAKRLKDIYDRMATIEELQTRAENPRLSSQDLKRLLAQLLDTPIGPDTFHEFAVEAAEKSAAAIVYTRKAIAAAEQHEADQRELEQLRREKAKREEAERQEEQRRAAVAAAAQAAVDEPLRNNLKTAEPNNLKTAEPQPDKNTSTSEQVNGAPPPVEEQLERKRVRDLIAGNQTESKATKFGYPGLAEIERLLVKEFGIDKHTAEVWITLAAEEVVPF